MRVCRAVAFADVYLNNCYHFRCCYLNSVECEVLNDNKYYCRFVVIRLL